VKQDELFKEKYAVAALIDHTLLKPDSTPGDIEQLCDEALVHCFASVCVNPCWVPLTARRLEKSPVRVCTVVAFPLGANATVTKLHEASVARQQGAEEVDMVMNIGALRAGDYHLVHKDIADVADVVHEGGGILKLIIESCLLKDEEKTRACRLAMDAGVDFVKTSTGFSKGGATVEDVRLMRNTVGERVGVKASGGIRTLSFLRELVAAGASRIGASAGVQILSELDGSPQIQSTGSYSY
jgi:deoxyribose-phosphate aldolase